MNLLDLTPADAASALERWMADRGEPPYRARQAFEHLWRHPVARWADATDLPATLRDVLEVDCPLARPALAALQRSTDGTVKFLWDFGGGGAVEAVLIPEGKRRTLCVSSQAGCAYGCVFCATGRMGFVRHLAAWEIAAQVRELLLSTEFGRPTNVVFMGMGEPLHNWGNVDRALTILHDPAGLGIGARHITVSTVGLLPGLERLAARPEQFRVALSLHGTTSETRQRLMPVERKYSLPTVIDALKRFPRRVTFEYVMIAGANDTPEDAERLAALARDADAHVNLLPLHPGGAPRLRPTPLRAIQAFARRVRAQGVETTVRRSRGLDISAACGQLRHDLDAPHEVGAEDDGHVEEQVGIGIERDGTGA